MRRYPFAAVLALAAALVTAPLSGIGGPLEGITPAAADSPGSTPGVATTVTVPFHRDGPGQNRLRSPATANTGAPRAIPFRRIPRGSGAAGELFLSLSAVADRVTGSTAASRILAPALADNFAGLVDDGTIIPPDTMGAAGPNHLVSLLNSQYRVFPKNSGTPLATSSLEAFWNFPGGPIWRSPTDPNPFFPFDPHILYDQYAGRFVAISVAGRSSSESWLLVAISNGSDPTAGWTRWAIPAADNASASPTGIAVSADFPMLGVDNGAVYVTANMFSDIDAFQYSKIWVIPTDNLLAGGPTLTVTERRAFGPGFSPTPDTLQPAHTFGPAPAEYLVSEGNGTNLWIVRITRNGGIYSISPSPTIVGISPGYTPTSFLDNAPQLGDVGGFATLDTSDTRLLGAVYRNGSLWTTHTVLMNGRTAVAWYQIDPATAATVMQGRVSDSTRWYYYPSIAVNANGDVALGFSGSSPGENVGAYYTARKVSDPPGTMQPVGLLKAGRAHYFKIFTGATNRWGDFSATSVDPSDNVTFWTLQEYAELPSGSTSVWGTWWGKFQAPVIAAPDNLAAVASLSPLRVALSWAYGGGAIDGFRVERKVTGTSAFAAVSDNLALTTLSFVDNTGLVNGTSYTYRIQAFQGVNVSYSAEASVTAPVPSTGGGGGGGGCAVVSDTSDLSDRQILAIALPFLVPALWLAGRRISRRRKERRTGTGVARPS